MLNDENKHIPSQENVESEIIDCFRETEQDINAYRIIYAYYNLQKTNKMIVELPESSIQKNQLKKQQKLLNSKLNRKIL